MRPSRFIVALCAVFCTVASAVADEPGPPRIPGLVEGPIKVSPWFVAAQPKPSASHDHYMYSMPPLLYYGWGGYGYYGFGNGWYGSGWYGYRAYSPIAPPAYFHP